MELVTSRVWRWRFVLRGSASSLSTQAMNNANCKTRLT